MYISCINVTYRTCVNSFTLKFKTASLTYTSAVADGRISLVTSAVVTSLGVDTILVTTCSVKQTFIDIWKTRKHLIIFQQSHHEGNKLRQVAKLYMSLHE